ncbi:hypothetical protein [Lentzea albida]|uniref:Uncharacterized protein n=1 Tax=Lentzea albida TaxID=65499 RepID=A0A1H9PUU2_9PSEU|nr:hypothetical protein [Lentzea albida]SER51559.1 hypothetical protein SAMN04488000_109254 [Lentzea albida]
MSEPGGENEHGSLVDLVNDVSRAVEADSARIVVAARERLARLPEAP